jgi:hypothetical protein
MIPPLNDDGNLPPGIHTATWDELKRRFGTTRHRNSLLKGLKSALGVLRKAGCHRAYIDGSFVTAKRVPQDIDVAWEPAEVDVGKLLRLEPVFGNFENQRAAQKAKFSGEFFPSSARADVAGSTFLEFFQIDKATGAAKGIVAIDV